MFYSLIAWPIYHGWTPLHSYAAIEFVLLLLALAAAIVVNRRVAEPAHAEQGRVVKLSAAEHAPPPADTYGPDGMRNDEKKAS